MEELHSGRIKVSSEAAAAEYRDMAGDFAASFAALLEEEQAAEQELDLPPVDPAAIAREIGLESARTADDFGRLRRAFAFGNHPDRVAPELRERAILRMQLANTLIDEARARVLKGAARR